MARRMTSLASSSCEGEDPANRHERQDDDDPNGNGMLPPGVITAR